mgnify:CR=1 FL=1
MESSRLFTSQTSEYNQTQVSPQLINFGVGQPSPRLLPIQEMTDAINQQWMKSPLNPLLLQYGSNQGFKSFRVSLAAFLEKLHGTSVDAEDLLVTSGNSHAINFITRIFMHDGDTVIMEEPSYFLAKGIFDMYRANIVAVPVDDQGMDVDKLRERLVELKESGCSARLLYTIPNFHNPTGTCLSDERKERLVELAEEFDFRILADEPYNLLHFDGNSAPRSMMDFDSNERVISAGSFSKILAPALRMGWIHTSAGNMKTLLRHGTLQSGGGLCQFQAFAVHDLLKTGVLVRNVQNLRTEFQKRANALMDTLDAHLPEGCSFYRVKGGYFLWVKVPRHVNVHDLLEFSISNCHVRFLPGDRCGITGNDQSVSHSLRLSFAFYEADELVEGAKKLCEALEKFVRQ